MTVDGLRIDPLPPFKKFFEKGTAFFRIFGRGREDHQSGHVEMLETRNRLKEKGGLFWFHPRFGEFPRQIDLDQSGLDNFFCLGLFFDLKGQF